MNRRYRRELDQVVMTEEGKRALAARLAVGAARRTSPPRRALRTSLVAAAVAAVLLAAAGAVVLASPILRSYLGGGAVYEENVQKLDLSRTVSGYTITLTDIAGDDQFLYLGIELAAPEGTVPNPKLQIGDNDQIVTYSGFEKGIGSGGGMQSLEDDNPTDNKLHFVWFQWVEKPLSGRDMTITFRDLNHREWVGSGLPAKKVVDVAGEWSFGPFRLDFAERTVDLTPNVKVPLLGGETTVASVKLTPLHVEVLLEGGCLVDIHTTGPEKDGCWGLCTKETTLALYGKDGTRWDLPEPKHSGSWINTEGDRTRVMCSYSQLLDLDDLGAIEVCGVRIPLE